MLRPREVRRRPLPVVRPGRQIEVDAAFRSEQLGGELKDGFLLFICVPGQGAAQGFSHFLLQGAMVGAGTGFEPGAQGVIDMADQQAGHSGLRCADSFASRCCYQVIA